jgi:hypothetical protein
MVEKALTFTLINLGITSPKFKPEMYDFIRAQNWDSATYYNNQLTYSEEWIANRQIVNAKYLQYWAQQNYIFSETDSLILRSIALETPYKGGDGVYTARCLLNLFDVESLGTAYSQQIENTSFYKLKVWPNPTNNVMTIEIPSNTKDVTDIEIYRPDAQLVEHLKLPTNSTILQYSTANFANGCYILIAKSNAVVISTTKFCIIH